MDGLKGLAAIVTGGALGIGRATALLMAREGASVAVRRSQTRHAGSGTRVARGMEAAVDGTSKAYRIAEFEGTEIHLGRLQQ